MSPESPEGHSINGNLNQGNQNEMYERTYTTAYIPEEAAALEARIRYEIFSQLLLLNNDRITSFCAVYLVDNFEAVQQLEQIKYLVNTGFSEEQAIIAVQQSVKKHRQM